jgi:hypothetical protein
MPDGSPSWSEGQVAALALIGSTLIGGDAFPNPLGPLLAKSPELSNLALMVAFPLVVMIPVLLLAAGRASWRARSAWTGIKLGMFVSLLTTVIVLLAYVVGLALGQPQLLKIGFSWDSLRDAVLMVATTTVTGAVLAAIGGVAGVVGRRFLPPARGASA